MATGKRKSQEQTNDSKWISLYPSSCFLYSGTGFVWAFIAPVILIILVNTGFFIMAATIMWRHQKKQSKDKSQLATFK